MSSSVLFDTPGPRARMWILAGNVLGALVALGRSPGWLVQLDAKGQLSWDLWGPALSARTWQYYLHPRPAEHAAGRGVSRSSAP